MTILEINGVDFSEYVVQKTYKIQNNTEYAEWVDGNRISHRTITRKKAGGTFNMTFTTEAAYAAFQAALQAATVPDGYTQLTLYASNDHQLLQIDAFVTISTKTVWTQDSSQAPAVFSVTVRLEER